MPFSPFFSLPATALPVRLLLGTHIAAGTISLLAGLVPMLGRKGGLLHVRAGRVYVYCMVIVAFTAVLLCVLQPLSLGRLFLTGIAILSFYLSLTGWQAARRRTPLLPLPDRLLAVGTVLTGLLMIGVGVWMQAVLFAFFGGLICLLVGGDVKEFLRPSLAPTPWLLRHFTRLGGSYISAFTAFVVVNLGRWLPDGAPAWSGLIGWMAPTFIGTFLISRTVRRYKARQQATTTTATTPTPRANSLLLLVVAGMLVAGPTAACASVPLQLAGLVTDTAGLPLAYATVGIVGKSVGTVADMRGRFRLELPTAIVGPTDTLRFHLLGYNRRA